MATKDDRMIIRDEKIHIKNEEELPNGKMISYVGEELEVAEKYKKELLAWDVSIGDRKMVWIISVPGAFNSLSFMQLSKSAENKGFKIIKKGTIEPSVLNVLIDKRTFADNQKATSDDSIVIATFELILSEALTQNVSDIHIEVRASGGIIRMRKNGEMMVYQPPYKQDPSLTYSEVNNLCSVIYNVLAATKDVSFDPRDCQQAAVPYNIKGQELKLRYQSVPAYPDGYDVILRVLPIGRSEDFTPLQKLGYTDEQVNELINITSRPVGSLIIAGVTGSGKSTTLKNMLMYVNANSGYKLKIYSIEDPPEYNIAKITQIPVVIGKDFDPTKMSPFEKPIKACMRGDPDIIMIGEVRDKITGDLTKKAVQSGHQVLTTVHATSALGIIERFQDFGLSRSVLGSPDFLTGLLYQKLLPIMCNHCAEKLSDRLASERITKSDLEMYNKISKIIGNGIEKFDIKIRNSSSDNTCPHCNGTGIVGRTVCAEVIMLDLEMIRLISEGKTIELMQYWRNLSDKNPASKNMRGKTSMEHAFQKMLDGIVCPYDVEASFRPINEMILHIKQNEEEKSSLDNFNEKLDKNDWVKL